MSKWGFVSKSSAASKFKTNPDEAAAMVEDMASAIVSYETTIDGLKSQVMELQTGLMCSRAAEAHLKGYVERVRELDPAQPEPERRR